MQNGSAGRDECGMRWQAERRAPWLGGERGGSSAASAAAAGKGIAATPASAMAARARCLLWRDPETPCDGRSARPFSFLRASLPRSRIYNRPRSRAVFRVRHPVRTSSGIFGGIFSLSSVSSPRFLFLFSLSFTPLSYLKP